MTLLNRMPEIPKWPNTLFSDTTNSEVRIRLSIAVRVAIGKRNKPRIGRVVGTRRSRPIIAIDALWLEVTI
jgi:hypothetical protein